MLLNFPNVHEFRALVKEKELEFRLTPFSLFELDCIRKERELNRFTWKTDPVTFKMNCKKSWSQMSLMKKEEIINPFKENGVKMEVFIFCFIFRRHCYYKKTKAR